MLLTQLKSGYSGAVGRMLITLIDNCFFRSIFIIIIQFHIHKILFRNMGTAGCTAAVKGLYPVLTGPLVAIYGKKVPVPFNKAVLPGVVYTDTAGAAGSIRCTLRQNNKGIA